MMGSVRINGVHHDIADPTMLLVHFLRDSLGLTGTKVGCETSVCGTCTVHVDGEAVKSCAILLGQVVERDVVTIEGISDGDMTDIQLAFQAEHGLQCGFCTPGMVMSTTALLAVEPDPVDADIVTALEGNLCRCTGYVGIVRAVRHAAAARRGETPTREAGVALAEPLARTEVSHDVDTQSDVEVV